MSEPSSTPYAARQRIARLVLSARTPLGLSAERVAERAGIGLAWYEWLEAGREISLSHAVLGWVAEALELSRPSRARLLSIAGLREPTGLVRARAELVPPQVQRTLDGFALYPAYVTGLRGDVIAWNEATEALYRCSTIPVTRRNVLAFLFGQPDVRRLVVNWEDQARFALRAYREALERAPGDAWLSEVHDLLARVSADFRRAWADRDAPAPERLTKIFRKPALGALVFELEQLVPAEAGGVRIAVYLPSTDETRSGLSRLLARHRRNKRVQRVEAGYRLVRRVKAHIDECYARKVSLDELAALAGVGRFQLARTFAAEVGFPPHAYQVLVRIEHAKRALLDGERPAEVATAVGFVDQSHLHRHFRRIEGVTPAAFVREASAHPPPVRRLVRN
jgi:AraC-like DNA-binding protein/transcriptional regulator with XRE-family HTH domain